MFLLQKNVCWSPKQWLMLGRPHYKRLMPSVQRLLASQDIRGVTVRLLACALFQSTSLILMSMALMCV